ncbi:unnamed protein product, partial [marine sediment metagenome]
VRGYGGRTYRIAQPRNLIAVQKLNEVFVRR